MRKKKTTTTIPIVIKIETTTITVSFLPVVDTYHTYALYRCTCMYKRAEEWVFGPVVFYFAGQQSLGTKP